MTDALATKQDSLAAALQAELCSLLIAPITIHSLATLEKTAKLARRMLEVRDPKAKLQQRVGLNSGYLSGLNADYDPEDTLAENGVTYSAIAPAPAAETFGASVLRELIPLLKGQNKKEPSIPALLDAKYIAAEKGDTALAERLQAKIDALIVVDEDPDIAAAHELNVQTPVLSCAWCTEPAIAGASNPPLCMKHYDEASLRPELPPAQPPCFAIDPTHHSGRCSEPATGSLDGEPRCLKHAGTPSNAFSDNGPTPATPFNLGPL